MREVLELIFYSLWRVQDIHRDMCLVYRYAVYVLMVRVGEAENISRTCADGSYRLGEVSRSDAHR